VRFDGREIAREDPGRIVRLGLAHVPEGREVFPLLSVRDNLLIELDGRPALEVVRALVADSTPRDRALIERSLFLGIEMRPDLSRYGRGDFLIRNLIGADPRSGSIAVDEVAGVSIDDGSGSIRVGRVAGDVKIDDGSGGIEIDDVTGNVSVDDGSGELRVRQVGGTVTVDDGSGSIDIKDVEKDVRLISTGSGGVDIANVKGRVVRSE